MFSVSTVGTNPYTGQTSFDAYKEVKQRFVSSKTQEVAKGWLWAIRIKAEIQSFFTKPVVLITLSSLILIAALATPPVNLGLAIISIAITIIASSVLGSAVTSTFSGNLQKLSNYYSAIANLAKQEITTGKSPIKQFANNNPFGSNVSDK